MTRKTEISLKKNGLLFQIARFSKGIDSIGIKNYFNQLIIFPNLQSSPKEEKPET